MLKDKLKRQITDLELDLKGRVVLTEAASGAYIVTPVMAAMAGAKVYAYSRTTRYGTIDQVFSATEKLMRETGDDLNIHFVEELSPEVISQADIITNSGHLRPLDQEKLKYVKTGTVIPLMYEAWEWRAGDLDLNYCRQKGILIGATNERHSDVDVFNYLGDMALKMIFDAGLTPYRNKFVLICNNDFGPFIAKTLTPVCEGLGIIDLLENKSKYPDGITWLSDFPEVNINKEFRNCEAIIFTAYPFDNKWIGSGTDIDINKIKSNFSNPFILRFAGDIDEAECLRNNLKFYPEHVYSGHMGILPSEIGFDPIIRLQAGGLKVGELLLQNKTEFRGIKLVDLL